MCRARGESGALIYLLGNHNCPRVTHFASAFHSLLYMYVWYVENVHFLFVSLSQCMLMCTPGVPLTPSNVMRIVREIEQWWGGIGSLTYYLYIPESKQWEIRQKFARTGLLIPIRRLYIVFGMPKLQ